MPRATYGRQVKARTLRLFAALLGFVNNELEGCEYLDIQYRWQSENSINPKLVFNTKLRVLAELTQKDQHQGQLSKTQIREALYRMEDFLGILTDNRVQKKGKEDWYFTLTLWSKDQTKNLERLEQEWERLRPEKSKQQEETTATVPKTVKPTRPRAGVPFQVPTLPTYFVDRPEVSQQLKQCLLSETTAQSGTLVVSAIYGLGGIGKSTLAAALAYDSEVQAHFPDGVLWATLGQEPDLLSFLSGWIQALKDYDYKPTSMEAASMHLRTLLSDKAALLVVDDAWNPEEVELFRVGGTDCRVLVTTREAPIKGATRYDLDIMTPPQALELLKRSRGSQLTKTEQKQAQALAKAVGYLPLALDLVAAQVAEGISWGELLADLQREIAILETLDLPGAETVTSDVKRKHYSLLASFNLSLKRLSAKQLQQFAWLGVLPEDVTITSQMAVTLWELNERQATKALRYLKSKALILAGTPRADGTPTYRLHDLLHDLACRLLSGTATGEEDSLPGLGLTMPQAHGKLLERYRAKTEKGLWHRVPDDGYIHTHLTWHFQKAGWIDEIHQMLREETEAGRNGWYQVCEQLGQLGSYVKDVARAWRLAEEAFTESPSLAIALQCRYALIMASLNSMAGNIPASLMAALVEKQVWTPVQGLAYARQVQDSNQRVKALIELLPYRIEILPEALELVQAIQDDYERAKALIELLPYRIEILPEALELVQAVQDEYKRAEALIGLLPYQPEFISEILEILWAMEFEPLLVDFLGELASHLPETLFPEALDLARDIQDEYERVKALIRLLPYRIEILSEVLEMARAIQNEQHRAEALIRLAPYLPEILPEALEMGRAIQDKYKLVEALIGIAPHLPEALFSETLEVVRAIKDEHRRAELLSSLALCRSEILPEALEMTLVIKDEYERVNALIELIPYKIEMLPEALDLARAIPNEYEQVKALIRLAPHLPEILLPEFLEMILVIQDEYRRVKVLIELIPSRPEILSEVLDLAQAIPNEDKRTKALIELAPHLQKKLLPEVLEATRAMLQKFEQAGLRNKLTSDLPDFVLDPISMLWAVELGLFPNNVFLVLIELAPHLSEALLPKALETAQTIQDEYHRAEILSGLAPHLPETLLTKALEATQTIQNEYHRAKALSGLVPYVPEMLPEALEAVRAIPNESGRAELLSKLACHFPEILPGALEALRAISTDVCELPATLLSKLASHLSETLLPKALEIARTLQYEYDQVEALSKLGSYFPEILPEALEVVRAIPNEYERAEALGELVSNLTLFPVDFPLWKEILHILIRRGRSNFLKDLVNLNPVIIALGGSEALAETAQAIQNVGRWWR